MNKKDIRYAKRCPNCGNTQFTVSAHVVQTWLVDCRGNYIEVREDATDVTHSPADDDLWTCDNCGLEEAGSDFNVAIPESVPQYEIENYLEGRYEPNDNDKEAETQC